MEVLNVVIAIVVLVVAVWVAIFGGVGALLSRSRGGSGIGGFAWGSLLGPIGWALICWFTRPARRRAQPRPEAAIDAEAGWAAVDRWDD